MDEPERVVLVGFMGAGKSAVGAALARLLGWGFHDMDREIERRHGRPVAAIFADRGEAFFRSEEEAVAREASRLRRHVIAAGGGAFAQARTREILREGAVVVWLRADLETLLKRIPDDGSRPLAASRERMAELLGAREASYRGADVAVDASSPGPEEVARRVARALEDLGRGKGGGKRQE
jgi:shikimate kinase